MLFAKPHALTATLFLSAAMLSACASNAPLTNSQTGAMVGAVVGGIAGNQFGEGEGKTAATIAGTMLGSYLGGQWGAQFDARDQQYLNQAVATGRPTTWQNPNTGNNYNVTSGQTYQANNTVCRPVTVAGVVDGRQQNIQMKACKTANGTWQAVN